MLGTRLKVFYNNWAFQCIFLSKLIENILQTWRIQDEQSMLSMASQLPEPQP